MKDANIEVYNFVNRFPIKKCLGYALSVFGSIKFNLSENQIKELVNGLICILKVFILCS